MGIGPARAAWIDLPMDNEDREINRLLFLEQTFDALRAKSADFRHLRMNRAILSIVVKSYFDDVNRHKHYHGSPRVDEVKQASFTIKWIAKLRPIQFDCDEAETTRELLYINEIFAVRVGLAFMQRSPDEVPKEIYADLLYTLHYRHVDERMLFIWLATLNALWASEGG